MAGNDTIRNLTNNNETAIQNELRKRFTGFENSKDIFGYESQQRELKEVLKRAVKYGESNSVIVIGGRGSGKTALLRSVLGSVNANPEYSMNIIQVYLHGLLQTDDRIAIAEIARQLHVDNAVGDRIFGSYAENLRFLLETLKSGNHETKVIIFIIDEFDLFCAHHHQTLLYNLFDVAQSSQAPIAIIGLTCRLDVMELLEKRVKSRFSHRIIYLFPAFNFEQYLTIFEEMLTLPESLCTSISAWNNSIIELKSNTEVQGILKRIFAVSKNLSYLKSFLLLVTCKLNSQHQTFAVDDFSKAYEHISQDSKMKMLMDISVLELCVLLAMRRLTEVYDGQPFNFEMVYKEYSKFASTRTFMFFDKAIIMKAFDKLLASQFVRPAEGTTTNVQKEYRLMYLAVEPSQIMDIVDAYPGLPVEVKQWSASLIA